MEKRWMKFVTVVLLCVCGFSGCTAKEVSVVTESKEVEMIKVVATVFPAYDWVREIINGEEDRFDLTLLLQSGIDLHNYQPSAEDIVQISQCDLFLYVGGDSDAWVEDILKTAGNSTGVVLNMMDILKDQIKLEEYIEGMEHSHEDGHVHDDVHEGDEGHDHTDEAVHDSHDHDDEIHEEDHEHTEGENHTEPHVHEGEYDEHVWLSLKLAGQLCQEITSVVCGLDPAYAKVYEDNCTAYLEKLDALDLAYAQVIDKAPGDTVLFADRFPFRYLTDDYGLNYYAAFAGCSAETEASFETIVFLAEKINELGLKHVFVIESSDGAVAKTVVASTTDKNQEILVLNSLQSVTAGDVAQGKTYLGLMTDNLSVLEQGLN